MSPASSLSISRSRQWRSILTPHEFFHFIEPQTDARIAARLCHKKIVSLCAASRIHEAFDAFRHHLHYASLIPFQDSHRYRLVRPMSTLLSSFDHQDYLRHARLLHSLALRLGLLRSPKIARQLIVYYADMGLFDKAGSVAEYSNHFSSWKALLSVHLENGYVREALLTYGDMVCNGAVEEGDGGCFSIVRPCSEIDELILEHGITWSTVVDVAMHIKCGKLIEAREVFDEMPREFRDAVLYNTMISGYMKSGTEDGAKEAFKLVKRMVVEGVDMNAVSWNLLLLSIMHMFGPRSMLQTIANLRFYGWNKNMDYGTWLIGLYVCSEIGSEKLAKEIHGVTIRACCDSLESVTNSLIDMYWTCNEIDYARYLFRRAINNRSGFSSDVSEHWNPSQSKLSKELEGAFVTTKKPMIPPTEEMLPPPTELEVSLMVTIFLSFWSIMIVSTTSYLRFLFDILEVLKLS